MAEIYIHIPGGEQLSIVPEASSSQDWALMGDNKLSLSFQRYECSILPAGAWCEFDGVIFYLLQEYKPTMIHSHLWQYNVAFVDGASWLGVTTALKTIDGEDAPLFTLTAPAAEHAAIIVSNLNRRLATTMWKVGSVIDTPNITIEYTGKYCGAVLQEIVDDQNTEWWVDGATLNIGRAEFGSLIELGYRDGLLGDITVTQADNMSSYRTLYPVGSTRNILPTKYGHDRLQLPNGQKSVMMNPAGVAELVEEAAFAGIYPRYKGNVTGVSTSIGQSNDGSQYLIYYIADAAIPFNPNEYEMPGLVKHITFQSGELMGAEFEVNYNPASKEFELITQFQENGSQLPGGMLIPQVGDEYVVWNISMPAEYYPLAEQELLEAAESFAAASTRESNVYKVKLDYIDVQERGLSLRPGQKVRLHSVDYFPEQGYYDSRITRVTRPVNYPGEYTIDVSAVRVVGSLTRLQTSLAAATTKVNNLSNAVQTVVQTVSNAVTLTGNQRVQGVKNFVDGIRINGSPVIEYAPVINTWLFRGNILAEGGMAAFSNIKGFTPSTITDAVLIDNRTIKQGADGLLFVDLNEVGGGGSGGGSVDPSQLEAYLKPYAKTADVASTYATIASLSAVTSRLNDFLSGSDTDTIINKWSELETFLAGLAESDDLATILSGKANKATTLAGYGITDAYTKSHIDSNFVTIGSKQEITGEKDFVGGLKVNGGLVEYNATLKTWVFNGDLLVTGGMAAFSNISGFKPLTITDAVLIDDRTIKRNADGLLYAVAQETDGINEEQLADYLTTNGYATQDWVTGRGYITSSALSGYLPKAGGNLTGNIIMTDGVTIRSSAGNVTGTLKFGADTVNFRTILGTEKRETLLVGTTAIKFWRGANNKEYTVLDSYNYADYALPKEGTAVAASKLATSRSLWGRAFDGSADLTGSLTVTTGEGYRINYNGYDLRFIVSGSSSNRGIWDNTNNNWLMYRSGSNDIYFTSGNIGFGTTSPTEKVTVGGNVQSTGHFNSTSANSHYLVKGREVIGSYNANYYICDSAAVDGYRTHLVGKSIAFQTSTSKVTNALLDESGNFSINGVMSLPIETSNAFPGAQLLFAGGVGRIGVNKNSMMAFYADSFRLRPASTSSAASSIGVLIDKDSNLSTTGDLQASGVLRLPVIDSGFANPRIVFGDSVIRIGATTAGLLGIYSSGDIRLNPNSASSANSTMGLFLRATGFNGINISSPTQALHVNGKGIFADATNPWVALQRNGENWYLQVISTGLKLGKTSASGILVDASGNLVAPGGVTATNSSDERLKRNLRKFNASKVLMSLGGVWEYEYIDSEVQKNHIYEGTHYGLIYQHVKDTTLDVMCHEREDGMGALNYIHPKFISLIAGATMENISEVEKLKRKIRTLEAKVKQLENRA